jgi:hypothetical protein
VIGEVQNLLWIVAAGALGFGVAFVFSGLLRLHRSSYLAIYVPFAAGLIWSFSTATGTNWPDLFRHNWVGCFVGVAIVTPFVVKNVLSQPPSPRRQGLGLFIDIVWPGIIYGVLDALLLSVLPILATRAAFRGAPWAIGWSGSFTVGVLALMGSVLVTAAYHLGYKEFRNLTVLGAMVGNGIFSLAFLLTGNPLAAIVPHAIMHVVAILHGRDSTYQLPPHDPTKDRSQT